MPRKQTKTELLIEYVDLSRKFDFSSEIEAAFEQDYVINHHLCDDNSWNRVATLLLIDPSVSAINAIEVARGKSVIDLRPYSPLPETPSAQ